MKNKIKCSSCKITLVVKGMCHYCWMKKYRQSNKFKEYQIKYNKSNKCKESKKAYKERKKESELKEIKNEYKNKFPKYIKKILDW